MILCDVNVLVNAAVKAAQHHEACIAALKAGVATGQIFASNATIQVSVVRIVTHANIFNPPMTPAEAFAFLSHLDLVGKAESIAPGPRHWRLFQQFVTDFYLSGSGVMDAWFAALAIEHEAAWWSCDAGFGKYPGLKFRNLLAG